MTPSQLDAERAAEARPSSRIAAFAARYPYLGWVLVLVCAPYLFWRAYKERKT